MLYEFLIEVQILLQDTYMSTYFLQNVYIIYIQNNMDNRKQNNLKFNLKINKFYEKYLHCFISVQHEQSVCDHGCSKSQTFLPGCVTTTFL